MDPGDPGALPGTMDLVRAMETGPQGDTGDFQLYQWSGSPSEEAGPIEGVNFSGLHPEALIIYPEEKTKIQVLSDDGTEQINGKDCKDEEVEPGRKYFRSVWMNP